MCGLFATSHSRIRRSVRLHGYPRNGLLHLHVFELTRVCPVFVQPLVFSHGHSCHSFECAAPSAATGEFYSLTHEVHRFICIDQQKASAVYSTSSDVLSDRHADLASKSLAEGVIRTANSFGYLEGTLHSSKVTLYIGSGVMHQLGRAWHDSQQCLKNGLHQIDTAGL